VHRVLRAAHAVGVLRGVGEQAGHIARVLVGQDLPQAGHRRLVARLDQPVKRDGGPRCVPQCGHQAGLEPGERSRDDRSGRLAEAGAPVNQRPSEHRDGYLATAAKCPSAWHGRWL